MGEKFTDCELTQLILVLNKTNQTQIKTYRKGIEFVNISLMSAFVQHWLHIYFT